MCVNKSSLTYSLSSTKGGIESSESYPSIILALLSTTSDTSGNPLFSFITISSLTSSSLTFHH